MLRRPRCVQIFLKTRATRSGKINIIERLRLARGEHHGTLQDDTALIIDCLGINHIFDRLSLYPVHFLFDWYLERSG